MIEADEAEISSESKRSADAATQVRANRESAASLEQ